MMGEELLVEMFGQEDTVGTEFYDRVDKELFYNIMKESIIRRAKSQNYLPIAEPVISVYEYLKEIEGRFVPFRGQYMADLIVFRTTVKVVKEQV